jgi:hypothetical protein
MVVLLHRPSIKRREESRDADPPSFCHALHEVKFAALRD